MKFSEYLRSKGITSRSAAKRQYIIKYFESWMEVENIRVETIRYQDILAFMGYCSKQGLSQRTIQQYLGTIRHYFDYLKRENHMTNNPVSGVKVMGVKKKTVYQILQPEELHRLYHHYPGNTLREKRDKMIVGLLVYQGLSTEDVGLLTIKHIKTREGLIDIPGSRKRESRTLQLEPHQVMDLYEYLLNVRPEMLNQSGYQTDQLIINTRITNVMTGVMKKLRKTEPTIRSLQQIRASVIVKWLRQQNLREAQYRAGHRYISSTEKYKQDDLEGLQEEVNRYHPMG